MRNCNDTCRPGFIPGPPAPNYTTGCALEQNPTLKTFTLPASVGTDEPGQPYAPRIGEFTNAIVIYESNGNTYIYDSLGTPTLMEKGDYNGPGPLPSLPIVQETGTSTTSVMSQNATTQELNKLGVEIAKTNNTLTNLSGNVNNNTITITSLEDKVQNLQESTSQIPNVVQATGQSTTNVMSQNAVTNTVNNAVTTLNNRIDTIEAGSSVEVYQTTGQSTTGVMSQDATTTAIDQVSTQVNTKQDTLVSGTNIKTVNGKSILGQGDLDISLPLYRSVGNDTTSPVVQAISTDWAIVTGETQVNLPTGSGTFPLNIALPSGAALGADYKITTALNVLGENYNPTLTAPITYTLQRTNPSGAQTNTFYHNVRYNNPNSTDIRVELQFILIAGV